MLCLIRLYAGQAVAATSTLNRAMQGQLDTMKNIDGKSDLAHFVIYMRPFSECYERVNSLYIYEIRLWRQNDTYLLSIHSRCLPARGTL